MSKVWYTGCTHYGHERMIELAGRPFSSVEEMDEVMIENHNKLVKPEDVVYILGDFAWHGLVDKYLQRLNGSMINFILGNHDEDTVLAQLAYRQFIRFNVSNYCMRKIQGQQMVLFHYPIEDWDMRYKGSIHLHAHTHKKEFRRPNIPTDSALSTAIKPLNFPPEIKCNRFHVGVDATNFAPVSHDQIIEESRI